KIALFGGIPETAVQMMPNLKSVFLIPPKIASNGLMAVLDRLVGEELKPDLSAWEALAKRQTASPAKKVVIGLVAKYLDNEDTYLSVIEALNAAAWDQRVGLDI